MSVIQVGGAHEEYEAKLEAQRKALREIADRQRAYIHQKLDEGEHPDDVALNAWWLLEIWTAAL